MSQKRLFHFVTSHMCTIYICTKSSHLINVSFSLSLSNKDNTKLDAQVSATISHSQAKRYTQAAVERV
jgi:hypothetical protein